MSAPPTRLSLMVLIWALAASSLGCDNERFEGIYAQNATTEDLQFVMVGSDGSQLTLTWLSPVAPGHVAQLMGGGQLRGPSVYIDGNTRCTRGDVIALGPDGREVA